jgi:hypothetical protein
VISSKTNIAGNDPTMFKENALQTFNTYPPR